MDHRESAAQNVFEPDPLDLQPSWGMRFGMLFVVVLITGVLLFGLAAMAAAFVYPGPKVVRVLMLLTGAATAMLPAYILYALVRRKARTGYWLADDDVEREHLKRFASRPAGNGMARIEATVRWLSRLVFVGFVLFTIAPLVHHQPIHSFNLVICAILALGHVPDVVRYLRRRHGTPR